MSEKQEQNRRITEHLLRYWLQLRGAREMPQEKELNPDSLKNRGIVVS